MKKTAFKRLSCLLTVLALLAVLLPCSFASAEDTYTMVVDGNSYYFDGTSSRGPIRFGAEREAKETLEPQYAGLISLVPGAFTLKYGDTVVSSELYSLELLEDLTFICNNSYRPNVGTVVYKANQTVWCKDQTTAGDPWNCGQPASAWTTSTVAAAYDHYKGDVTTYTESTSARCVFNFKDASGNIISIEGTLDVQGKCQFDDCHMLTGNGASVVKVAHTVTLDNQSATTAGTASVKVAEGSALPAITVPAKSGYFFFGYYSETNGGGSQYYDAKGNCVKNWDKDADGTLYAYWTSHVASVTKNGTTTYYTDLSEAVAATSDGCTLTLLRDFTTSSKVNIPSSCTVDLGGYTLTGGDVFNATNGATVRVTNGTIYSYNGKSCVGVVGSGTLYVDHVCLAGYNAFYSAVSTSHTYLGEGVTTSSTLHSLYSSNGSGVLHITDGVYTAGKLDDVAYRTGTDRLFITGGCFYYSGVDSTLSSFIKSGYTVVSCEHGRSGYYDVKVNETAVNVALIHTDATGKTVTTKFAKLSDAVNAAATGDTVQLLKDITESNITVNNTKNFTLDLNGKTVTAASTSATVITNNGTLTLTDTGSTTGNITGGAVGLNQNGTLKLAGKASISGNTANLYLSSNKVATVVSGYNGTVGVTTQTAPGTTPVAITGANTADYSGNFLSDNANYTVINDNNTVKLSGHIHGNWSYNVTATAPDTLNAVCGATLGTCPLTDKTVSLTIEANSKTYDGFPAAAATLTGTDAWTGVGLSVPIIYYEGTDSTVYASSTTPPTDAGTYKATVTAGTVTAEYGFTVSPRAVTLTSESATKTYDGTPLTKHAVSVGGSGFAGSESFSFVCTGSQTDVGCASNHFTYTLTNGAKEGNYAITLEFGTLTVNPEDGTNLQPDTEALKDLTELLQADNPDSDVNVYMVIKREVPRDDKVALYRYTKNRQAIYYSANLYADIDGVTYDMGDENEILIAVTSNLSLEDRENFVVYRLHEGSVDKLTETPNDDGECFALDTEKNKVTVTAKRYSTYAIVYDGKSPKTGDDDNLYIFSAIALATGMGLCALAVMKRKKKENR